MHRSRLALLVVLAPVAACSTRKNSDDTSALLNDSSLAHLDLGRPAQRSAQPQLPDACTAQTASVRPASSDQQQAAELTRQAYDAELVGDLTAARSLLLRASRLDATNKTVAYHLGRTSEALGDRAEAVGAYCHFLALSPTADTTDVRQRLTKLSQAATSVASAAPQAAPQATVPVRRTVTAPSHGAVRAPQRVAVAPRAGQGSRPEPVRRDARSAGTSEGEVIGAPARDGGMHRTTADGDVVAVSPPAPAPAQSPARSSTRRGGLSRTQGAGIGAAAGAIIAGAAGHSVKSAVIGAAAGGILGAVVTGGGQ